MGRTNGGNGIMNPRRTTIAGITGTPAEKRRDKEKKERKEKKPFMGSAYGEGFYARAESKPKPKPKGPAVTVDESALPPKRAKQPTTVISGGGRRGPKNPSGRIVEKEYSNPPRKVKMK
jgi:hypothetical protein|tara:strand:- start:74 stop:430 length:357 start_codon:yes stop_codon:yes gene_type:complete